MLNTFIPNVIDTGVRFADEIVEPIESPEDGETIGVEIDGHVVIQCCDPDCKTEYHIREIKRVIAAAYEAGREQGRKESLAPLKTA